MEKLSKKLTEEIKAILIGTLFLFPILLLTSCNTNPGRTKGEKIEYLVEQAFNEHHFIGSVVVADSGVIIFRKNYGNANAELVIPISDSTKFLIASLSKPVTAVLILKLVEQGKISVQDELLKFFPGTQNSKVGKVTIHHLLTHTSGIKEVISEEHAFQGDDLSSVEFSFDPGTDFSYSNSGYVLLKRIAEVSSGETYGNLVHQLVFNPLNMTSSGLARKPETIPNLAIGYKDAGQRERDTITYSLEIVDGAGSVFSTAADMIKFSEGINSEKFLSRPSRDLMFQQHVKEKFGYGWNLRERGGVWDNAYHKGNLPGYTSLLSRKTSRNQTILLLSNASNLDLDDLENDIARVLKRQE